jgi:hypothetical protein
MPGNTVVGKDVVFISQDFLANYFAVKTQTISNWYSGPRGLTGMPAPMYVHHAPGKQPTRVWHTGQLPAWGRWYEAHLKATGKHTPVKSRPAEMRETAAA